MDILKKSIERTRKEKEKRDGAKENAPSKGKRKKAQGEVRRIGESEKRRNGEKSATT